jgi:hypothetical protein
LRARARYSTIREKLNDPAYAGYFLRYAPEGPLPNNTYYSPPCDNSTLGNTSLCSVFFHDQDQTPWVASAANPAPDGVCVGYCDVGNVPIGE